MHRLIRRLAQLLLGCWFRRVRVAGAERIPTAGPIIVCANHNGALFDPLALLAIFARPLRPLTKAPLFRLPILGQILRALGALPVYRPQDRHIVSGSNAELARASLEALARGEAILVFPEGISKPTPTLAKLRPGAARFAIDAEAASDWGLGVKLLPVGIHIEEGSGSRRGRLFIEIGEPIAAADVRAQYATAPQAAIDGLLARLDQALRALVIEVGSVEELRLLRLASRAWAAERGLDRLDDQADAEIGRAFGRGYRVLRESDPAAVANLRVATEAYWDTLDRFGLTGSELAARHSTRSVAWFLGRELTGLTIGAPLGIVGELANLPPRVLVSLLAARYFIARDSRISLELGVAAVVFPLYWLAAAAAVGLGFGPIWGVVAIAALPLSAWFGLRFREHQARFRAQVRGFLLLAGGGGLRRHLGASRREIHDLVEALRDHLGTTAD